MSILRSACLAGLLGLTAWTASAQMPVKVKKKDDGCGKPVSFKSVSIHARESLYQHLDGYTNEGFSMRGATFRSVVAYVFSTERIEGLPDWAKREQYDVIAEIKPEDCCQWSSESNEEESLAVRLVLADKLKLKWHTETRTVKAFSLVVGKNPPTFKALPPDTTPPELQQMGLWASSWRGTGTMKEFAEYLSTEVGHPVMDDTALSGRYRISFDYRIGASNPSGRLIEPDGTPSPVPESASITIFDYVKQVGLELKSEKMPMDYLVIDQIERPEGN